MAKERKTDFAIIFGWLIFVLAYFIPDLISRKYLPHLDLAYAEATHQWIPFWEFTSQMLNKGLMPIWCPHFFCGFPYLVYPPNNLYYPFFLFLAPFSYQTGIYMEHLLGFFFTGFFAYASFRRMGFSPFASLAGMLCIATGFFYVNYSTFSYYARFWLFSALSFWGISGLIYDKPRLRHFVPIAFGYAMVASGDIEQVWYRLWFDLGWVLYASPSRERFRRLLLLGMAIGSGLIFLACPVLLNLIGYIPHSLRGAGVSFTYFQENTLPWQILVAILFPVSFPWTRLFLVNYLGISALVLAIAGFISLGKKVIPGAIVFFLYGLYVMGEPHLLYLFYHLPIFNQAILHYTAMLIPTVIFAYWVARGLEKMEKQLPRKRFFISLLFLVFILLLLELWDLKINRVNYLIQADKSLFSAWFISLFYHWGRSVFLAILFGIGVWAFLIKKFYSPRFGTGFIIALLIVDFSLFSLSSRPRSKWQKFEMNPILKNLLKRNQLVRWWPLSLKSVEDTEMVPLNGMRLDPLLPGTHTPLAFWRVPPRKTAEVINLIAPGFVRFDSKGKLEKYNLDPAERLSEINPLPAKILSLLNVGVIVSKGVELKTNWPVREIDGLSVYQNPANLPRAFLVSKTLKAKTKAEELNLLSSPEFEPDQIAIVPADFAFPLNSDSGGTLQLIDFRPGFWSFQAQISGSSPQLFFLSETYYPGWRAFLDGVETRIYRTNYAFQGVIVLPGRHLLELRFEPVTFHLGLWTALSSYFTLGLILISRLLGWTKKV